MHEEQVQIGYSEEARAFLKEAEKDGLFKEMGDGFRFAIGLAVARGLVAPAGLKTRTFLGSSSFDPDGSIRAMIQELYPDAGANAYGFAERLAEAGIQEMRALHSVGQLRLGELLADALSEPA